MDVQKFVKPLHKLTHGNAKEKTLHTDDKK